jgi:hypothetical protein
MNDSQPVHFQRLPLRGEFRQVGARFSAHRSLIQTLSILAFCLFCFASGAQAAAVSVPVVDRLGAEQGSVKFDLVKGTVSAKVNLAMLPALIDTGTEQFTATIYKAYLVSSTDAAIEVPLATLYPTTLGKAVLKVLLKGNVSLLGIDRFVVVAYSKDGLSSFDVLTGTLTQP